MSRGPIFIESPLDEGGRSCHEIAAVALQIMKNALEYIRGAALTEGKADNPECRALLGELAKYSRSTLSLRKISSTASTIFGVEQPKMLKILTDYEVGGDGAYDKALRAVKKSSPGSTEGQGVSGPLPSCYFDPFNIVTTSEYSMGAPFYNLPLNDVTWHVVRWLGYVAKLRDYRYSPLAFNLAYQIHLKWFQAKVSDALIRLPNECNEKDVWQELESIGLHFSNTMKEAIIKQMKGDYSHFTDLKFNENHWDFDQMVCDDAMKSWADKWADQFAEELNNTDQGIIRYGKNTLEDPIFRGFGAGRSNVERWIQQNTIYGVHQGVQQSLGPHGDFMRILEKHCRKSWFSDLSWAFQKFRRSARSSQSSSSQSSSSQMTSLIRAGTLQTCFLNLASELQNLGLNLTGPVKALIFKSLTEDGLTSLQQHAFRFNRALVVKHAASQIKAVLKHARARKRTHD